jgi:hypothetical protein
LIEDEKNFPRLLNNLDRFKTLPRPYRHCYRGLLHGYFGYFPSDAVPVGKANWMKLRGYLDRNLGFTRIADTVVPGWVEVLHEHRHLLTDEACRDIAKAALDGDSRSFDAMKQGLDVSADSWVVRNFIIGQVEAAAKANDSTFKRRIEQLRAMLKMHPLHLDDGLARLLTRFHSCEDRSGLELLRDLAVEHWGNPWLVANDPSWSLVSVDVRKMVTGSLRVKLMRDFFSLLSADGINDPRRLEFWLRYEDRVADMYFILGTDAHRSPVADFKVIRAQMKGRLQHLTESPARNNAFLMRIGRHWMVEFGERGNACFVFNADETLPFRLEGRSVSHHQLRNPNRRLRLTHVDTRAGTWERNFDKEFVDELGLESAFGYLGSRTRRTQRAALPPQAPPAANATVVRTISPRETAQKPTSATAGRESCNVSAPGTTYVRTLAFTEANFGTFINHFDLAFRDNRDKNGALWVMSVRSSGEIADQLGLWGFTFSARRGGWYREA